LPDIIVLDLGLPDIDGLTALDHIRHAGLKMPVCVLTGSHDKESKIAAREHDVIAYFEKPFEARVLIARIQLVTEPLNRHTATKCA
jgi:DNA-binding response OmpR family regulator